MAQPDPQSARRVADAPAESRGLVAATVAYIVLVVAGLAALGTTPAATETGSQLVAWLREHRGAVQWCMWAFTLGTPVLALMLALERRLHPVTLQRCLFHRRGRHSYQQRRSVMVLGWSRAARGSTGARDGARAPRCRGVFWPDPHRRDHDHDGSSHAARVAK